MGTCKLCFEEKLLLHNHLLGRAFYAMNRVPGAANPNPVLIMRDITVQSSRQVEDYVFCWDCEQLLSRGGEEYMTQQVYNGTTFPLADRLKLALPLSPYRAHDAEAFSGRDCGIATEKMAYFALSVIWRSTVHVWRGKYLRKYSQRR